MLKSLVVLALLCACVIGSQIPHPWASTSIKPDPEMEIKVTLSLVQENLDQLETLFWERADPHNPKFSDYLSREELAEILSPGAVHEKAVTEFLIKEGFEHYEIGGLETRDVLVITSTVEKIEATFGAKFVFFKHEHRQDRALLRSIVSVDMPEEIKEHVQLVHGFEDFPPLQNKKTYFKKDKKVHHLDDTPDLLEPTVVIKSPPNGRSQQPGSSMEVMVQYRCLTSKCVDNVTVSLSSNNPNINSDITVTMPASECSAGHCEFIIEVEFYVPYIVSAYGSVSNGDNTETNTWEYPIVVNPHVVPQMLWDLYGMDGNPRVTNMNATQSVVEFEQQYYSTEDLNQFFELMGLPQTAEVIVEGTNYQDKPGGEANLDIQWIMAMAPGATTYFWSVSANSAIEIDHILTWCYQMGNFTDPPLVNSLSYGMTEGNVDKFLGDGYLNRTNVELQKLALQGLTIIIADGDAGANDIGAPPMSQLSCYPSHPDWPSDSPYVMAVGSTFITPLAEPLCYENGGSDCLSNPLGEVTTSVDMGMSWTTGGGFSFVEPRPSYQNDIVGSYLMNTTGTVPEDAYFNRYGRAYADVVTVGHNLEVVLGGSIVAIDGTSASAPIFGGMITVLNDLRMNAGKAPLGYFTNALYAAFNEMPSCFNDIVVGHNRCATYGFGTDCCDQGFSCTPGWDPVSGLGSPNMNKLKDYVMNLP